MPNLPAHDVVTGLPTPLLLHDRLAHALAQARRENGLLALVRIDLAGLESGDDVACERVRNRALRAIAARLRTQIRESDTLARMDDAFVLILPDLSDAEAATAMTGKLVAVAENDITIDGGRLALQAHVGIALFPAHGDTPADLLRNAGLAAARAGMEGHRMHFFSDPPAQPLDRSDLTHELGRAIEQRQLRLEYQPQVDLRRQRPAGVEALLRWRHPVLGDIEPQTFVEIAEASGQIGRIGKWALTQACAAAVAWPATPLGPIRVAVNVSTGQMIGEDLPRVVARALERSGLPAARLELELTERSVLGDGERGSERVLAVLQRLHAMGVGLALDDFGMGHASLRHLACFPLDALKIDRSFIANVATPSGRAIVQCVIELAHRLGLRATAEGIETETQLATLRALGCHEIQGHMLSGPLAADEVARWLRMAATRRLPWFGNR